MTNANQLPHALKALQRLIVHAKAQAYESDIARLIELLNDVEMLPEFLAAALRSASSHNCRKGSAAHFG